MREELKLRGMVLSAVPQGEYDKRLVILTQEKGRITAFAAGVRREKSSLQSKTQMFVVGTFTLIPGRESYRIAGIDADEYFRELTADIDAYCYASYFCEVMAYFTHEGERSADYLNLLYVSLKALVRGSMPTPLVRCVYEIKLMDVFGQGIQSFHCPVCGSPGVTGTFDAASGGLLCEKCSPRARNPVMLTPDAVYTLQYICGAKLGALYNFNVKESVLAELSVVSGRFMDMYAGRKFKAAEVIDSL